MIIWAAGFIDGEGSIGLKTSYQGRRVVLCLQVAQVAPEPLLRLQSLWGGALRARKARGGNRSDYYQWFIWCQNALKCCQDIVPFLSVKQEQAKLAIEFQTPLRRGIRMDAAGKIKRQEHRNQFALLNQRGGKSHPSTVMSIHVILPTPTDTAT